MRKQFLKNISNGFLWVQLKHIFFGKRFNSQKELTAHVLLYLFMKGLKTILSFTYNVD